MGNNKAVEIIQEINKVIIGKENIVKKVMTAILAKGHILIDDVPGVGKTTLAIAFSKTMDLECKRLQFTPDVLPSDITGFSIYNKQLDEFQYKPGAIMCNLFLADEVNRTSSKTQSALLEVMEEGKVTVDGVTRKMKSPFVVIATENPIGSIGTHMLPESQLDRFIIKITIGYPKFESEINILKSKQNRSPLEEVKPVVSLKEIEIMQEEVESIYVHDEIYEYITKLANETRNNKYIELGVSPRGTIALCKMAKATAYINGREYVIPDDVLSVVNDVFCHRIVLNSKARVNNISVEDIMEEIKKVLRSPRI